MASDAATEAVKYLEERLRSAGLSDVRVILFGSHAAGTAREGSDIDVAIISPSFTGKGIFERARMTQDAELQAMRRFLVPFDVLTLTPEEYDSDSPTASFIKAAAAGH